MDTSLIFLILFSIVKFGVMDKNGC